MQKILIIAYFFPPCNLTASQRPFAWAKYLPKFGYEPIIVTRNWDIEIGNNLDMSRDAGDDDRVEETSGFKVWYMKYRGNLRDRFFVKYGHGRLAFIRKVLTFIELTLQNMFISHLPYYNIYLKAHELLRENKDIRKMIITANPFVSFHFGYLLKRKFPDLQWFADYRDDWTTSELSGSRSFIEKIVRHMEHDSEKKWVSNASCITSISEHYVSKISSHVRKPGHVVLNGYSEDAFEESKIQPDRKNYIINYTGSLYNTQPIEIFLDAFKELKKKYTGRINIVLQFPGLAYDKKQEARVLSCLSGFTDDIHITERMSKYDVMNWQRKANLMLMIGHKGLKGISSSKLYEYIGMRKKVLLVCNDHDIMESILFTTGLGIICETSEEINQAVSNEINTYILDPGKQPAYNKEGVNYYSRENQVHHLANILNQL